MLKLGQNDGHDVVINRLVHRMLVDMRIFEEVPSRELIDLIRFTTIMANQLENLFLGLYKEVCFLFSSFLVGGKLTTVIACGTVGGLSL